jgi:hypothetical protein
MNFEDTHCIRCDAQTTTYPGDGLTLTFNQETGAVKLCEDCADVAKQRDHF